MPALAAAAAVAVLLGVLAARRVSRPPPGPPRLLTIAVLPFRASPAAANDYPADGITESLIRRLGRVKGLAVPAWSRVRAVPGGSEADAAAFGRKLAAEAVVHVSIRTDGGQLLLDVHATDVNNGSTIWRSGTIDASTASLPSAEKRLAEAVASRFRGPLTAAEKDAIYKGGTDNGAAYDLVLRARRVLRNGPPARSLEPAAHVETAIRMLESAVRLDPEFVEAYGWLALAENRSYFLRQGGPAMLRSAISHANQALSRDPELLVAMRALTHIQHSTGRPVEGLLTARRALTAHPDDLDAIAAAAEAYFRTGLSDRAMPLYERALRAEPANREFRHELTRIYFFLMERRKGIDFIRGVPPAELGHFGMLLYLDDGQTQKALDAIRARQPGDSQPASVGFPAYIAGAILAVGGDLAGARRTWLYAVREGESLLREHGENPFNRYGLGLAYATFGQRAQAKLQIRQFLAHDPQHPHFLFFAAEIHALLGERVPALDSLKAAMESGFFNLSMVDAMTRSKAGTLHSLRNDPEFLGIRAELARRVDELRRLYGSSPGGRPSD